MDEEARPLIDALELKKKDDVLPAACSAVVHTGCRTSLTVTVVTPGRAVEGDMSSPCLVGTDAASLTTFLALSALKPDLLINAGTCGGFIARGGSIGDVYVVSSFAHHDRRIAIPGYSEWVKGTRVATPSPQLTLALGANSGACSTGNSLDCPELDKAAIDASGACVKDMEGAAVAWAASLFSVPLIGIKVVTDLVDGDKPTSDEFMANLGKASQSLQRALIATIDFVAGVTLAEI
eukprot:TRINITY_DN1931_c0_g1_i1.p1 TRINITY_DN1931_c0_g1~~TRINITY_DN1931_c0_g1_i1.p1  ORF type:complete len:276 (+),score=48.45 TRINITY_DN1931_c0_g1_i1:121-828(+)